MISLTTPLMLGGLALLALPLLAHWMHRRSQRTLIFPSLAMLQRTLAHQTRFHRLRRYILLALRLLAVACIVLAFARPNWVAGGAASFAGADDAVAVVLILDVSASTAQMDAGLTELESLKASAGRVLDDLRPGVDVADILIADASPQRLFPRLTANLAGLRSALGRLQPTGERADFAAALGAAGTLLSAHAGPRRVVILSDLQRSNWAEQFSHGRLGDALPAGTLLAAAPRPQRSAANIALLRPAHFPPSPLRGDPFDLSVVVHNYSDQPHEVRIRCQRWRGEGSSESLGLDELTVLLAAHEERAVSFPAASLDSERQLARFDLLTSDALEADNSAWLVVQSSERTPVVVVSDDDPEFPGGASYYLMRALAPDSSTSAKRGRFAPRRVRSASLTAQDLESTPLVVVGYLGTLPADKAKLLSEFVERGGGLLFTAGEGPVDRNLAVLDAAAGEGRMLPWRPGPRRAAGGGNETVRLQGGRWDSRWLREFDEQSQSALQGIQFLRPWTSGATAAETEILLTFDDGSPALGVRPYGQGVFLSANFSPEGTTSDLARHGAFVALLQMLLQGARSDAAAGSLPRLVGAPLTWPERFPADADGSLSVVGPDQQPVAVTSRLVDEELVISIPRVLRPGVYQLRRGDRVVDAVAFAIDERESDLTRLPAAELEEHFSANGASIAAAGTPGELPSMRGSPLWGGFLAAALCAIGAELALLGWWRK